MVQELSDIAPQQAGAGEGEARRRRRFHERVDAMLASPLPLLVLLIVAGWLRARRLELRFNQITFAYAAYFQPYVDAYQHGDVARLFTTFVGLHPPLYSFLHALVYRGWGAMGGYHLLSGMCSVLAVAVTFQLGREAFGRAVGLLAAALMAVSTYQLHYALEVNNYPLLTLTSAVAQLTFVRLIRRPGERQSLIWALASTLNLYTHALAGLVVLGHVLAWGAVHRARRFSRIAMPLLVIGTLCAPLLRPVLELAGRGSTYHNESLPWGGLWTLVVRGMAVRFGPPAVVVLLGTAVLIGLHRTGLLRRAGYDSQSRFERTPAIALTSTLLVAPVILLLSKAGIAAPHQYPYYLLVLPAFLTLAARGLAGRGRGLAGRALAVRNLETQDLAARGLAGESAAPPGWSRAMPAGDAQHSTANYVPPPSRAAWPLASILTIAFVLTAQWAFGGVELAQAHRATMRFEDRPHAVKLAIAERRAGDELWLIAPALFPDDDKRAADPVYGALSPWVPCRYHQPDGLRFEYVDYTYGQPVDCGDLTLFTFTDVYFSSMTRLLAFAREHKRRVRIVLYDTQTSPDYPVRLEALLAPFHPERRKVDASMLYTVEP